MYVVLRDSGCRCRAQACRQQSLAISNFHVNKHLCARQHTITTMLSEEQLLETAASDGSLDMYGPLRLQL